MSKAKIYAPTILVILDGFGYSQNTKGNAIAQAHMLMWHKLVSCYPHTLLHASGEYVGLPDGYIGNSEVGHLTLGAGRVVQSFLTRINNSIKCGSFFANKTIHNHYMQLKKNGGALHLMGLLSDGGVHGHEHHLHALIKMAQQIGLKDVYIHAFLDGRDVAPMSAQIYLQRLENVCRELQCGVIASIHGRFYAMDRDKNWDRTAISYGCLVGQQEEKSRGNWQNTLSHSYAKGITDEFIIPILLNPSGAIKHGDGIIFFNFRQDRAQQITESFINPAFSEFTHEELCSTTGTLSFFATMCLYKEEFAAFNNDVLFNQKKTLHTLLDEFALQMPSSHIFIIAETEKYAHVTYFFRGMVDKQLKSESRLLVPSVKVKSYENYLQMSAQSITQYILHSIETNPSYFYLVNYANLDMVGHSGNLKTTIQACNVIDQQLTRLYQSVVEKMNGTIFIVGDHGNAEEKIDLVTGMPKTAHTINPVPFVMVNKAHLCGTTNMNALNFSAPTYGLANVAPTILKHLNLKIPTEMTDPVVF